VRWRSSRQDARLGSEVIWRVNEVTKDLRESEPLPRNSWPSLELRPGSTGQRPRRLISGPSVGDRGWNVEHTSLKEVSGQPELPADRSGYREERDWSVKVTA
jgi:hypothetical protein